MDASITEVGAVSHQCTYFSRKLSLVEQNYDIGDRDLLAIKLALEEWRHWLEGVKHLFEVITYHQNQMHCPAVPPTPLRGHPNPYSLHSS